MKKGFTLIEILIALAIFSLLASLTAYSIFYAFNTKTSVAKQAERLNNLQMALLLIERDILQIVLRTVNLKGSQVFPAFIGEPQYFEFTRGGWANPNSQEKRSQLRRVAILCQKNTLLQRTWFSLDSFERSSYEDQVLLTNLRSCQFSYLNQNLQSLSAFQPNQEPLPKAIQMQLRLGDWGKMSYLFIIPGALYHEL